MTDREKNALWAAAMAEVAQEFTASLPHLPAAANHLLSGLPVPAPRP
ncbi:MAG: hypothetical protein ABSC06_37105 [Rhodopila sp.]